LLALAWLLWLGCVALPRMRGMEPRQVFMQFTAMPLHGDVFGFSPPVYSSEQQLEEFRSWQTITFTGNLWADYFSYKQARLAATRLQEDYDHKTGLRIAFHSGSVYKSFVFAISTLSEEGITKWWLDIQHQPTTLYAFTMSPKSFEGFLCGTNAYITRIPEPTVPLTAAALFQPDWRNSTLLLLLLAALSAIRLYRQQRTG
jgi:hypothetical protein